jgi:AcrR family transcriptional regulator
MSETAEKIIHAARLAMAEKGPGPLTMSAVAVAAGLSRPTLYRWFPTKADLLAAVTAYEEAQFDIGLQVEIDAHRSPRRRLDAALRYLVNYLDDSMMPDPISVDPAFAIESIAQSLPPHVEILVRLLGDALLEIPAVRRGTLSKEQAAEVLLRLAYSHYLVPHVDPYTLLAMVREFAGVSRRASRLAVR